MKPCGPDWPWGPSGQVFLMNPQRRLRQSEGICLCVNSLIVTECCATYLFAFRLPKFHCRHIPVLVVGPANSASGITQVMGDCWICGNHSSEGFCLEPCLSSPALPTRSAPSCKLQAPRFTNWIPRAPRIPLLGLRAL